MGVSTGADKKVETKADDSKPAMNFQQVSEEKKE
jgi:hypothetical protein